MKYNIAIDGPAGAGKSSVAKLVAQKLNLTYIDTGAMYRAITWKALHENLPWEEEVLSELTKNTKIEFKQELLTDNQQIFCDNIDVTDAIRDPLISKSVSLLAAFPLVRQELTFLQQKYAETGGVIMDGRDIGTYVLPEAKFKFYLTASIEARSRRRYEELINKGISITLGEVKDDMLERDQKDQNREHAPLSIAKDAEIIDTTDLTLAEVVDIIVGKYER